MMWRFIALSCFCGLTACSDQSFFGLDEDLNGPGPSIEVTPAQLDFGIVKDGEETVLTFRIENVGKNDLSVESVELRSLGAFTLLDDDVIFGLPPGADREMDVVFSPLDPDTNDGTIIIFSDDPERRALEVPMVGFGAAPKLQIDPDPYDFGVEYVGCENDDAIRLSNVGSEVLVIDEISYDGDPSLALIPDTAPVLPLSLEPGEETHVRVAFDPESDAQFEGALQVHSNDPRGWVEGMQLGEGEYAWMGEDRFTVPEAPPVDILFAVDQSCSMDDDNARLASNFSSFISKISTVTTGWRIGVVTKDNGCFKSGYLEETTAGYQSLFNSAVLADDGGSYTEALLTLTKNSLSKTGSGQCNAGFLRSSALLHVIMVSDEPEQSSSTWSTLVSQIEAYKSDPSLVKLSAIAGDYPSGCSTAQAGTGYYQAVSAKGGEYLSICSSSWDSHIDKLALASLEGLNEYALAGTPDEASLRVFVEGVEWTTGWSYDAATNSIVIEDDVEENDEIVVQYGALADC